jgi:hypothetical protein
MKIGRGTRRRRGLYLLRKLLFARVGGFGSIVAIATMSLVVLLMFLLTSLLMTWSGMRLLSLVKIIAVIWLFAFVAARVRRARRRWACTRCDRAVTLKECLDGGAWKMCVDCVASLRESRCQNSA